MLWIPNINFNVGTIEDNIAVEFDEALTQLECHEFVCDTEISPEDDCDAIRRGKLNSQFIVTARKDFQILSENFRFQIEYSNYMALFSPPL
jgi:hypothetical protein